MTMAWLAQLKSLAWFLAAGDPQQSNQKMPEQNERGQFAIWARKKTKATQNAGRTGVH